MEVRAARGPLSRKTRDNARGSAAAGKMLQTLFDVVAQLTGGIVVPLPVIAALLVFLVHTLIILDFGAGNPIFYPIFRPLMKPYKQSRHYSRLASKYMS